METTRTDEAWSAITTLQSQMAMDGLIPGAPCRAVEELDRVIYGRLKCFKCKATMAYFSFFRKEPRKYKVFQICENCGQVEERGNGR